MNLTEIKNRVGQILSLVCLSGEVTPPMKRELLSLDERANHLQDTAADHSEWMDCFNLRKEISSLLESEAAIFA